MSREWWIECAREAAQDMAKQLRRGVFLWWAIFAQFAAGAYWISAYGQTHDIWTGADTTLSPRQAQDSSEQYGVGP